MNLPISVRSPDSTARLVHPVKPRRGLALAGPAFIAAVAYIDPGNVATNISAGAKYGYLLLWVVVAANAMAMLVQYLSAKLGIATGRNLPELCRERCSRPVRIGLWLEAELIVIMTDLAEIIGGAVALGLLFGLPLPVGGVITGAGLLLILALRVRDRAVFPAVVMGLLAVVALAFAYQAFRLPVAGDGMAAGLVPGFGGTESVLLAAGIVGATVMPHAIYLHSALTQDLPGERPGSGRPDAGSPGASRPGAGAARRRALRATRWDVVVAMSLAGFINITILVAGTALAASDGETLEGAHEAFGLLSGPAIGAAFAIGLLASGLASACVGVYTGQIVMQGFVKRRIPLWVRRVVSMAVPLVLLSAGLDPMLALVLSQVALSFGIPFALVPLLLLTRDRGVMGDMVNRRLTTVLATVVATLIVALNLFMIVTLFREVAAP